MYLPEEWLDGKKVVENLIVDNHLKHLMAAIFGRFLKTDAVKAVS